MGTVLVAQLKAGSLSIEIIAVGTNSATTSGMLKAGTAVATGEDPVIVCCKNGDIVTGPMGVITANAMGEITPKMLAAVSESPAQKLHPGEQVPGNGDGVQELPLGEYVKLAVRRVRELLKEERGYIWRCGTYMMKTAC